MRECPNLVVAVVVSHVHGNSGCSLPCQWGSTVLQMCLGSRRSCCNSLVSRYPTCLGHGVVERRLVRGHDIVADGFVDVVGAHCEAGGTLGVVRVVSTCCRRCWNSRERKTAEQRGGRARCKRGGRRLIKAARQLFKTRPPRTWDEVGTKNGWVDYVEVFACLPLSSARKWGQMQEAGKKADNMPTPATPGTTPNARNRSRGYATGRPVCRGWMPRISPRSKVAR